MPYNEEILVFAKTGNGKTRHPIYRKSESSHRPYILWKINSTWLQSKWKTVKFLEENIGENLDDCGFGD